MVGKTPTAPCSMATISGNEAVSGACHNRRLLSSKHCTTVSPRRKLLSALKDMLSKVEAFETPASKALEQKMGQKNSKKKRKQTEMGLTETSATDKLAVEPTKTEEQSVAVTERATEDYSDLKTDEVKVDVFSSEDKKKSGNAVNVAPYHEVHESLQSISRDLTLDSLDSPDDSSTTFVDHSETFTSAGIELLSDTSSDLTEAIVLENRGSSTKVTFKFSLDVPHIFSNWMSKRKGEERKMESGVSFGISAQDLSFDKGAVDTDYQSIANSVSEETAILRDDFATSDLRYEDTGMEIQLVQTMSSIVADKMPVSKEAQASTATNGCIVHLVLISDWYVEVELKKDVCN